MAKFLTSELLSKYKVPHGFFTRQGGVSIDGFNSLNCNPLSKDSKENICQNTSRAALSLGFSHEQLYQVKQIHSDFIHEAEAGESKKGDALYTNDYKKLISVYTADCVPILLYAANIEFAAAIHAGWRGALGGIIQVTISKLIEKGAEASNIIAAIGPCIRQESYEFGQETIDLFLKEDQLNKKFFNGYNADIPAYCKHKMNSLGIKKIDDLQIDTYKDSSMFFSYRRYTHEKNPNNTGYGAQLSAISIPKKGNK